MLRDVILTGLIDYISNSFNIYDLLMNVIFKFQFSLHFEMIITKANSLWVKPNNSFTLLEVSFFFYLITYMFINQWNTLRGIIKLTKVFIFKYKMYYVCISLFVMVRQVWSLEPNSSAGEAPI